MLRIEGLEADVGRPRVEMRLDPIDDPIDSAPGHRRVDEAIAPAPLEIARVEAESHQVAAVVRQSERPRDRGAGACARAGR